MAFARRGVPDVFDISVRSDQECAADYAAKNAAHELLRPPCAVSFDHFVSGIAEQRKVQFLLGFKFCLRRFIVGAGAENRHVQFVEVSLCVAKLGRFGGSTGSTGLRVEKQHDALAFEIAERNFRTFIGLQSKPRSALTYFQHRPIHGDSDIM